MWSPKMRFCGTGALAALFLTWTWMGCSYDYSGLAGRAAGGGTPGASGATAQSGGAGESASPTGGTGVRGGGGTTGTGGQGTGGDGTAVVGMGGGGMDGPAGVSAGGTPGRRTGGAGGEVAGQGNGAGGGLAAGPGGQTAGAAGAGGAAIIVLSVDFVGGLLSSTLGGASTAVVVPGPTMSPSEIAGVRPASHWNGATGSMGSLLNLVLSNGVPTSAVVTWRSPPNTVSPGIWSHNYSDVEGDVRMMNGYLDPLSSSTPAVVVVANLPTAMTTVGYDVYVYVSGDIRSNATRTSLYSIGATSFAVNELGPTPAAFQGFSPVGPGGSGNYVVFRRMTSASFTLTATPGGSTPTRAPVDGMQIVSPAGS